MSKETLQDVIGNAKSAVVQQIKKLTEATSDNLANGGFSAPEIAAALHIIEALASAGSKMFQEPLIAATDAKETDSIKAKRATTKENCQDKEGSNPPKTFGELLRLKIAQELLPRDGEITKDRLLNLLQINEKRVKGTSMIKELVTDGQMLKRSRAIEIIESVLKSQQNKKNIPLKEAYTRTALMQLFRPTAAQLNIWGQKIGHDWDKNPIIDRKTALAIRGLTVLDKLLGKPSK